MLFRNALCFDLAHISHSCSEYLSLLQSYYDRRYVKKKIRKQIIFVNVKCNIVLNTYQWYEQHKGKQKPTKCIYQIGKSTSLLMVSYFYFVAILQFSFLDLLHFHKRNVLKYFALFNDLLYIRAYTHASMAVLQNGCCPISSW